MDTTQIHTETWITENNVFIISQTIDGETNSIMILHEFAEHIRNNISEYLILTNYKPNY
jgi:hypothetical protein